MIFLDTNVVSAMMSGIYSEEIAGFYYHFRSERFYLPAIVIAEIQFGIQKLPAGQRHDLIEGKFLQFLSLGFGSRIVAFDETCAIKYASVRIARQKLGRPVTVQDAMIGGMALAFGASVATRNVSDFDGYGLLLINPWIDLDS